VSGRSYLSIGEVLTLLRQEFPDVTISKIRFLESQGLVDPERTPSGYRKFYDQDVDRLRWVLRQQRDQFLPLKVIKGRLEQEGDGEDFDDFDDLDRVEDLEASAADLDEGPEDTDDDRAARPEPVLVGQGASGAARTGAGNAEESLPGFDPVPPAPVGTAEMTGAPFVARADEGGSRPPTVAAARPRPPPPKRRRPRPGAARRPRTPRPPAPRDRN